jgi:hypothetical protein
MDQAPIKETTLSTFLRLGNRPAFLANHAQFEGVGLPSVGRTRKRRISVFLMSHRFLMNDDWPPDRSITITAKNNYGDDEEYKLHLWTFK